VGVLCLLRAPGEVGEKLKLKFGGVGEKLKLNSGEWERILSLIRGSGREA
jgi:hypothetical protein